MREFVGVKPQMAAFRYPSLKRDLIIFSRIAINHFPSVLIQLTQKGDELSKYYANELSWLYDQGFIFDPVDLLKGNYPTTDEYLEAYRLERQEIDKRRRKLSKAEKFFKPNPKSLSKASALIGDFINDIPLLDEYTSRTTSIALRAAYAMDAYPILSNTLSLPSKIQGRKADVVQVVINALPVPDDSTSWEQIQEFRTDPDTFSKFLALRNWMNDAVKKGSSLIELEDKLEYLLNQYQRHMEIHKLKANARTLETVIVASAEFLEDLVKLQWGKIAKGLFSFRHRKIELLESELTAPGSEIAFVAKAKESLA